MIISTVLWSTLSFAQELYEVKRGDTLSGISKKVYPRQPIYGPDGKIQLLIRLNKIKRPNFIYPKQTLITKEKEETDSSAQVSSPAVSQEKPAVIEADNVPVETSAENQIPQTVPEKTSQKFIASVQVGFKNLNVDQSKALGRGKANGTYIDTKLNLELRLSKIMYGVNFDSYVFDHDDNGKDSSVRMNSYDLYLVSNSIIYSLASEQLPLFRNNGGTLELTRQTAYSASLGYLKLIRLTTKRPACFRLMPSISVPFYSTASRPGVTLENTKGYGAHLRIDFLQQFYKGNNYTANLSWTNQADYEKFSYDAKWEVSRGRNESTLASLSSTIGVRLDY